VPRGTACRPPRILPAGDATVLVVARGNSRPAGIPVVYRRMLHVIHLLGPQAGAGAERDSRLLTAAPGRSFPITVRRIGPRADYRHWATAAAALRFGSAPTFDLIHVWDTTALFAALVAAVPIVFTVPQPLSLRERRWIRFASRRHSFHVVTHTAALRDACLRLGVELERCHVIPPGVDWSRVPSGRDEALRQRLGFAPDDFVLLAPGETSCSSGHQQAVWAASILHTLDPRYRLLLWGKGKSCETIRSLAARLKQPRLLVMGEKHLGGVDFEGLPAAADAALLAGGDADVLAPLAACMAAGLPIVAAETSLPGELLEHESTGIVVAGAKPRQLAAAVLKLREEHELSRRLGEQARAYAAYHFDPAQFVAYTRRLYWHAGMTGGEPPPAEIDLPIPPSLS